MNGGSWHCIGDRDQYQSQDKEMQKGKMVVWFLMLKSRGIILPTNVHLVKAIVFSSSHVWMWELGYKESWVLNNWCFWTVVLEKTLDNPFDSKEIQSILNEISPEFSLERLMLKLKLQLLWPPDAKSWLIGKDPDGGKNWRWEEKGTAEDEIVGWHHQLYGDDFG